MNRQEVSKCKIHIPCVYNLTFLSDLVVIIKIFQTTQSYKQHSYSKNVKIKINTKILLRRKLNMPLL